MLASEITYFIGSSVEGQPLSEHLLAHKFMIQMRYRQQGVQVTVLTDILKASNMCTSFCELEQIGAAFDQYCDIN